MYRELCLKCRRASSPRMRGSTRKCANCGGNHLTQSMMAAKAKQRNTEHCMHSFPWSRHCLTSHQTVAMDNLIGSFTGEQTYRRRARQCTSRHVLGLIQRPQGPLFSSMCLVDSTYLTSTPTDRKLKKGAAAEPKLMKLNLNTALGYLCGYDASRTYQTWVPS
ncbi:hypothetical protein K470DRAFT_21520 [Piedraia hortae CBS 480.64]|uniref:Uncharacterized protein n=1 Tax=Piedraia hortae CBS 480.64 TaxID=1314780 RepID=A0A6A7C4S7_9PEZI|nr:hypothetical protein K470DRAFT_21520 [Piedraia hortae CBS 480.64]